MGVDIYEVDDFDLDDNVLTNFPKEQEPIYRKAIEEYGWDGLYIDEDAYWNDGTKDDSLYALKCIERRNLTDFWSVFDKLKSVIPNI